MKRPTLSERLSAVSLQWQHSLKTRVTLITLAIFVGSIWALAAYSSNALREDMQHQLGKQQFATVSAAATDVDAELTKHLRVLSTIAARMTPAMLGNRIALQAYLQDRVIIQDEFNAGALALRPDGTVLANSIDSSTPLGSNLAERPHIATALHQGRSSVGLPHRSQTPGRIEFDMVVPIWDAQGQLIGALVGVTDMGSPNFLDKIANNRYGDTGGYLLNAPQQRLVVTATDKSRVMQPLPPAGVNTMLDRFVLGFEGYGVAVNARGIEELTSAKGIPASGWFLTIVIPTAEAFAPVRALRQRVLVSAVALMLLAGALVWWMLRRQLAPMQVAAKTLAGMTGTDLSPQALAISRPDEVGDMISGFNRLLAALAQRDAALRASEEKFRLIAENTSDGIVIFAADSAIQYVSPSYSRQLGYSDEEELSRTLDSLREIIHPDDRDTCFTDIFAAIEAKKSGATYTYRARHKDGHYVWREDNANFRYDRDGRYLGAYVVCRDISARKQAEEALRESELRYRTIADFTTDWEYWLLPDGTLRYMSPSCAQISGYSAAQFYADPQLLTHVVHADDVSMFAGHSHHLSRQGVPLPIDFRIQTQDGETRWVSHVCQPVFDPAGQPLGLRGSNRDITERKQVEAALARSHADLQRFAEVTAHHLQEPARRIANYAERLGKQLVGRIDDAEARLSLDYIGQQARRQQNLLRDVERYLAADQPRGKLGWVDVQGSVSALLARWKTRIEQAGATITLGELPAAWIDPPRLNDLFEVALDNALNHGRSAQPLQILIEGKRDGHQTCYIVSDNGPGVELQYRERIFRVFERLAPGSEGAGTGIGLAILRRIAESCGGAAWMQQGTGGGARLVFELAKEKLT